MIVHLVNGINTTTGHGSKEEKQYAMREEVVPIAGVQMVISGERPRRARQIPNGDELRLMQTGDGEWTVTVNQLDVHAVVVFEY